VKPPQIIQNIKRLGL